MSARFTSKNLIGLGLALGAAGIAHAAGGDVGEAAKQPTNWTAIIMFTVFVLATLWITKWAAGRTKSAADFYTAGGGITGFQNGLAIAGDYMSAASFLGISAAVMATGYDGLIYSIGFLVGWPILTFLMAERLRNLRQTSQYSHASKKTPSICFHAYIFAYPRKILCVRIASTPASAMSGYTKTLYLRCITLCIKNSQ